MLCQKDDERKEESGEARAFSMGSNRFGSEQFWSFGFGFGFGCGFGLLGSRAANDALPLSGRIFYAIRVPMPVIYLEIFCHLSA